MKTLSKLSDNVKVIHSSQPYNAIFRPYLQTAYFFAFQILSGY
jgi:hypothetical protein